MYVYQKHKLFFSICFQIPDTSFRTTIFQSARCKRRASDALRRRMRLAQCLAVSAMSCGACRDSRWWLGSRKQMPALSCDFANLWLCAFWLCVFFNKYIYIYYIVIFIYIYIYIYVHIPKT